MSQMPADQRAAAAVALATRLRRAAATIRREAGALSYHPQTGRRPEVPQALAAALDEVERTVRDVQRGAQERAADEAALLAAGAARPDHVRRANAGIDTAAQVVVVAAEVLRTVLPGESDATVDAPYGAGAPRRHHPGAMATILAERVEELARTVEMAAVVRANLDRAAAAAASASPGRAPERG
jgi:hypothetical protein